MCSCEIDWNAIGTWLTALATCALVGVAWLQLRQLRKQLTTESDREKRWRTIDACERWSMSEVLRDSKRQIFRARTTGALQADPLRHARDIRSVLNYLDAVARAEELIGPSTRLRLAMSGPCP
ncbi:MAG: hypothetical protein SWI22_02500 [Pseudomonadota bacterium]|nr:hypothetical protein [Pseudomonadota bacterium]